MKTSKLAISVSALCFIAGLTGCTNDVDAPKQWGPKEIVLSRSEEAVNDGVNDFSFKLTNEFFAQNNFKSNPNPVISPLGANFCLSMVANAAGDKLSAAIQSHMGYDDIDNLNSYMQKLTYGVPCKTDSCQIIFANSVWHSNAYNPTASFRSRLSEAYDAAVEPLKATPQESADAINRWSLDHTDGVIGNITDADRIKWAAAFIANAIDFKAKWLSPFKKGETKAETFHGAVNDAEVQMMHQSITTGYYKTDRWESLVLPYKGKKYSFIAILPAEGTDILDLNICSDDVDSIFTHPRVVDAKLSMPKFECYASETLDDTLEAMNINLFTDLYGMTGVGSEPLLLSVRQHSSLSVDEEGTVIKVVTTGEFMVTGNYIPAITFTIDRPFQFLVRNNQTGSIVIAGIYTQPE